MRVIPVHTVSFTAEKRHLTDEQKKKVEGTKEVAVGGTAIYGGHKITQKQVFQSFKTLNKTSNMAVQGMNTTTKVIKQSTSLWSRVANNVKWAKGATIDGAQRFAKSPLIKSLVENRAFRGLAGVFGYGFGFVSLITGLTDISNTAAYAVHKMTKNAD
ncbi:MAG: hypothetical protein LBJ74_05255 [Heliobacteriaceae bacterium]|jgi:hypothetical protein|nr:hypothetical protein [Heliobacteriaceae bacterium]